MPRHAKRYQPTKLHGAQLQSQQRLAEKNPNGQRAVHLNREMHLYAYSSMHPIGKDGAYSHIISH